MKLPSDFAKKIQESLGVSAKAVEQLFTVEEDKNGYFTAKLNPKQFLDKSQFKTMCALSRDLGGEGYLQGAKTWKVPGPYAKTEKSPGRLVEKKPETPSGSVVTGKKEPLASIQFAFLPVKALLSMPYQTRKSLDDPDLANLAESLKAYGILEPIVVRQKPSGLYEIVMGERRVKAAAKAGLIEVPAVIRTLTDEEASVCALIENIHRRDLSDEEKSQALAEFARTRHWNAQQIADHIKMSPTWVYKYLPDEFKQKDMAELGKMGGEAKADAATRHVANGQSQDMRQGIPCDHCGEPVSKPVHLDGKFYHEDCAEQVKAEKEPGAVSESVPGPFEKGHVDGSEEEPVARPEPVEVDTGFEWECPECQMKFQLIHVKYPDGRIIHKFEAK
jgi:ParB/RepB/Spo0J family partition protein